MRILLNFFLCLNCCILSAQKKDAFSFNYADQPKLNWDSFKGPVPVNTPYAASVNTGVSLQWSYSTGDGKIDLDYDVEAYAQPNFSWVVEKEKDEELLAHEQLHFDITEIHARMLRKRIAEYEFGRNIRKPMQRMLGEIKFEREKMQNEYDQQTAHSKNTEQQKIWEKKVASLLEKYQDYAIDLN